MTFVSYAQNFEDVMLWRALRDVGEGFYIDAGAHDPHVDSVTKAFYEKGWHGINIEPVGAYCERLQSARPRDINLCIALGSQRRKKVFYEIQGTGFSTFDRRRADRCKKSGEVVHAYPVDAVPLTDICKQYAKGPIHFLKIDVEGAETAVLRGLDFQAFRPWVILVEAVTPIARIKTHKRWENILLENGYRFVYYDGLNRFYLDNAHVRLKRHFEAPPNVFDGFVNARQRELELSLGNRQQTIADLQARIAKLQQSLTEVNARLPSRLLKSIDNLVWAIRQPRKAALRVVRLVKGRRRVTRIGLRRRDEESSTIVRNLPERARSIYAELREKKPRGS